MMQIESENRGEKGLARGRKKAETSDGTDRQSTGRHTREKTDKVRTSPEVPEVARAGASKIAV
eukprot:3981989-Pyramimonas_sp.AAC.1